MDDVSARFAIMRELDTSISLSTMSDCWRRRRRRLPSSEAARPRLPAGTAAAAAAGATSSSGSPVCEKFHTATHTRF